MIHVHQPSPKSCGQTVLAMLCGVDVQHVIAAISDRKGTSAKQLIAWLQERGWTAPPRPRRYYGSSAELGDTAILRVIWEEKRHRTHWSLWAGGGVWDPAFDHTKHLARFPDAMQRPSLYGPHEYARLQGRVMSFLPLIRAPITRPG